MQIGSLTTPAHGSNDVYDKKADCQLEVRLLCIVLLAVLQQTLATGCFREGSPRQGISESADEAEHQVPSLKPSNCQ